MNAVLQVLADFEWALIRKGVALPAGRSLLRVARSGAAEHAPSRGKSRDRM